MWLSVALSIAMPYGALAQPSAVVSGSWDRSVVMASSPALLGGEGSLSDASWSLVNRNVLMAEVQVAVTRDAVPVASRVSGVQPADVEALLLSEALTQGWVPLAETLEGLRAPLSLVIRMNKERSGAAAVNVAAKSGARSRVVFLASDPEVIRYAKNKIPESLVFWEADRAFGEEDIAGLVNRLVQSHADGVATTEERIHPALARAMRQQGYPLMALDVTPGNAVARLRDLGVNILRADEPVDVRSDLKDLEGQRPWHLDW